MLLFRDEEHVERSSRPHGAYLTLEQMWHIAHVWYLDRADPNWRRKTAEEAEALFAEVGLTSSFWRLRS